MKLNVPAFLVRTTIFRFAAIMFMHSTAIAQNDTLIFNNGDIIVGEVKDMKRGVVKIETDYSKSDFTAEWKKVSAVRSLELYSVALRDKSIYPSVTIGTVSPGKLILTDGPFTRSVDVGDIVYFRHVSRKFIDRLNASVDLGFSLTKANNLKQFNASANLGYNTENWSLGASYRQVGSTQDDVESITRAETAVNADYSLQKGIYLGSGVNMLSSSELQLKLRTTAVAGVGYFLVRSNTMYWSWFLGGAANIEDVYEMPEEPSADRESFEGIISTEFNIFDFGDLKLITNIKWFPSITESGRHRVDFKFDTSYDLPLDFYVKAGLTYNFDNKPAPGVTDTDYVIVTGFGWKL